jgi:DNA repair protein RadC
MTKVSLNGSFKVRELQVRFKSTRYHAPAKITSPQNAQAFLLPIIKDLPREQLFSLALDSRNDLIGFEVVSQGTADSAYALPAEVFKAVLLTNATAFILAHNHPSGNCSPSQEDRNTAKNFAHAARLIGLKMLDFIIVTGETYYSFAQSDPLAIDPN